MVVILKKNPLQITLIISLKIEKRDFLFKKTAGRWPWACDEDLFDALLHDNDTRNCAKNHHLCLIMYVAKTLKQQFRRVIGHLMPA